jgi:hypothetical protein
MVDMSAVAGLMTSLRSVVEITKAMKDVRDANLIQTKVFELTREIMSAQGCAIAAQAVQSDLLNSIRELEEKIAQLETWNTEKQRYKLTEIGHGMITYTLKDGMENGEPQHHLCASCYNQGQKSVMQTEIRFPGRCEVMVCHFCGSELYISGGRDPAHNSMKRAPRHR